MTTAILAPYVKQRFVDANGAPLFNGTVTTYAAGTTTPITTYKDSAGVATNSNPITLNFRGECDIWLLPNVAYKFVVADSLGNFIYTVDNIVQSQLITLYGGVDSGVANAYVINFTANFTSLTDGIVIIWIPSHTNTSASTININGLGLINIVNADGSSLSAGELTANAPAQILIKGGQAILQNPFATFQNGSFTVTYVGGTTAPTGTAFWTRTGNIVALTLPNISATSNSTGFSFTGLPANLQISSTLSSTQAPIASAIDNGANAAGIAAQLASGSGTIIFAKNGNAAGWTAAGLKSLGLLPNTIVYSVQ